jgi:hypothetical protein
MKKTHSDETSMQPPLARRPYEAPRIEESGAFERLVLACVRTATPPPTCLPISRRTS